MLSSEQMAVLDVVIPANDAVECAVLRLATGEDPLRQRVSAAWEILQIGRRELPPLDTLDPSFLKREQPRIDAFGSGMNAVERALRRFGTIEFTLTEMSDDEVRDVVKRIIRMKSEMDGRRSLG